MLEYQLNIYSFLYKKVARPIFFLFTPDVIHHFILSFGNILGRVSLFRFFTRKFSYFSDKSLKQNVAGLNYSSPVGLSEGFDKDANLLNILPEVGFGFQQIGTITFNPYSGNPKPWAMRLKKSRALTVNFGLKNLGAKRIAQRIKSYGDLKYPIGISVGKTNAKYTDDISAAIKDYTDCLLEVFNAGVGDFYTLNISCPNTSGGEPFISSVNLEQLLQEVHNLNINKPIFLKMPINLPWDEFKTLGEIALKYNVSGLIIGNLNKDRNDPAILDNIPENVKGNISGKPTEQLSNELISQTYKYFGDKLVIIGVGGIFSAEDAYEKIKRGASLVQLITGMIYEGPQLIKSINYGLVKLLKNDGYSNVSEAVGKYHRSK